MPSNDPVVMEMASKAIGRLAMAGDTFTAEYVEFEVKRALEWLGADRNEGRRHAAVSDIYIYIWMDFFVFTCVGVGWLGLIVVGEVLRKLGKGSASASVRICDAVIADAVSPYLYLLNSS